MRRHSPILIAVAALALAAPPPAGARILELGGGAGGGASATPSCPGSPCLAVTRTTGFQTSARERRNLYTAPGTGRVVAFTVKLGKPSATQIGFFNRQAGGAAKVRIAVLRPAGARAGAPQYRLNAQSDDFTVEPYFGQTVQFPLYTSLLVRRGYVVALSVATWAPVLAVSNLNSTYAWRSSRVAPCSTNPERQPPQTQAGSLRSYFCLYRPAQLTYSVTLVTSPAATAPTRPSPSR
ncbi:MAG: hypothetical protein ACJ76S_03725 [Solirubrobacteraceae bacterium]